MEQQFIIQPQGDTLTILQGKTADPVKPQKLKIEGRIDAPRLYLSKKLKQNAIATGEDGGFGVPWDGSGPEVDINKWQEPSLEETVIIINEDTNTINLRLNPNHPNGTIIIGKLELNPDLVAFGIALDASSKYTSYNRESLYNLIRWNKRFFKDELKANELMAALKKLDVKATIETSVSSDNRANRASLLDKKVDAKGIPDSITLSMPIYDGEGSYDFPVEICIDTMEGYVKFWLESPYCAQLIDTTKLEIFTRETKDFEDFVVVWE